MDYYDCKHKNMDKMLIYILKKVEKTSTSTTLYWNRLVYTQNICLHKLNSIPCN